MTGARLPEEWVDELEELARRDRRTLAQVIAFAVEEYLEKRRAGAPVVPQATAPQTALSSGSARDPGTSVAPPGDSPLTRATGQAESDGDVAELVEIARDLSQPWLGFVMEAAKAAREGRDFRTGQKSAPPRVLKGKTKTNRGRS